MSKTVETTHPKSDTPKSACCCGGDHDKNRKHQATSTVAPAQAKQSEHGAHEPAGDAHSSSGCCGGGKAHR